MTHSTVFEKRILLVVAITLLLTTTSGSAAGATGSGNPIHLNQVEAFGSLRWIRHDGWFRVTKGEVFVARTAAGTWLDYSLLVGEDLVLSGGYGFVPEDCVEITPDDIRIDCDTSDAVDYWFINSAPGRIELSWSSFGAHEELNGRSTTESVLFSRKLVGKWERWLTDHPDALFPLSPGSTNPNGDPFPEPLQKTTASIGVGNPVNLILQLH